MAIIFFLGHLKKKDLSLILGLSLIFLVTTLVQGFDPYSFVENGQMLAEFLVGLVLTRLYLKCSEEEQERSARLFINICFFILLLELFEFLIGIRPLTVALSQITLWQNLGNPIPKFSLFWANPNWATYFIVILYSVSFHNAKTVDTMLVLKVITILLVIFSKTSLALFIFAILFRQAVALRFKGITIALILSLIIILSAVEYLGLKGIFGVNDLYESASYLRRYEQYVFFSEITAWYPQGFPTNHQMLELRTLSFEDTVPSILLITYSLGYGLSLIILVGLIVASYKGSARLLPIIVIFGFSFTYSFLSISGVAAVTFFAIGTTLAQGKSREAVRYSRSSFGRRNRTFPPF